ncbi:hypothetical protein AAEX28_15185 [Lentisphaerota bacterium WC36G]|nr:hypothetical protein LJT99_01950 [Lentisphaerae bacterium WC36]
MTTTVKGIGIGTSIGAVTGYAVTGSIKGTLWGALAGASIGFIYATAPQKFLVAVSISILNAILAVIKNGVTPKSTLSNSEAFFKAFATTMFGAAISIGTPGFIERFGVNKAIITAMVSAINEILTTWSKGEKLTWKTLVKIGVSTVLSMVFVDDNAQDAAESLSIIVGNWTFGRIFDTSIDIIEFVKGF